MARRQRQRAAGGGAGGQMSQQVGGSGGRAAAAGRTRVVRSRLAPRRAPARRLEIQVGHICRCIKDMSIHTCICTRIYTHLTVGERRAPGRRFEIQGGPLMMFVPVMMIAL